MVSCVIEVFCSIISFWHCHAFLLSGKIPEWLEGSLIRNGSGMFEIGETKMNHLFDGLSVMHRFAINGYGEGKSTYQNRILQSDTYKQAKAANRLTMHQFGKSNGVPCEISTFKVMPSRYVCISRSLSISVGKVCHICR